MSAFEHTTLNFRIYIEDILKAHWGYDKKSPIIVALRRTFRPFRFYRGSRGEGGYDDNYTIYMRNQEGEHQAWSDAPKTFFRVTAKSMDDLRKLMDQFSIFDAPQHTKDGKALATVWNQEFMFPLELTYQKT